MSFVLLSPHFPSELALIAEALARRGVCVLGIADEPWENLSPALRSALSWYYRVPSMYDYDQMLKAMGFLVYKFGRIAWVESFNEHWLGLEARLREDFNVPRAHGWRPDELDLRRRKSAMKPLFAAAGVKCARHVVPKTLQDALGFADAIGYPLFAKPDLGVGAIGTAKARPGPLFFGIIRDKEELVAWWALHGKGAANGEFVLEEYIQGTVVTFDGIANDDSEVVYAASHEHGEPPGAVFERTKHLTLWTTRQVPEDLQRLGMRIVKVFGFRKRFFHIEFFRRPSGELYAIEVNLRMPGGCVTDMWNYASDINVFEYYAQVVESTNSNVLVRGLPLGQAHNWVGYGGRKSCVDYEYTDEEVAKASPAQVVTRIQFAPAIAEVMGDDGWIFRSPDKAKVLDSLFLLLKIQVEPRTPPPSTMPLIAQIEKLGVGVAGDDDAPACSAAVRCVVDPLSDSEAEGTASDINVFEYYAQVVESTNSNVLVRGLPLGQAHNWVGYGGRKSCVDYEYTDEEVAKASPAQVVTRIQFAPAIAEVMGDDGWIFRSPDKAKVLDSLFLLLKIQVEPRTPPPSTMPLIAQIEKLGVGVAGDDDAPACSAAVRCVVDPLSDSEAEGTSEH
eukprot:m51a1_g8140 hypothetical protein (618) ;mRNA; r:21380-24189